MQNLEIYSYGGLLIVGLLWGVTNPFLELGVKSEKFEPFDFSWKSFLSIILRIKFAIPFGIN